MNLLRAATLLLVAPAFSQTRLPFPAVITDAPQGGVLELEQDHVLVDAPGISGRWR